MNKKLLFALMIFSTIIQTENSTEPILPDKPKMSLKTRLLTTVTGIAVGATVMYGFDKLFGPRRIRGDLSRLFSSPSSYIIAGSGIACGRFAAWLMRRSQPEGKFDRAYDILKEFLNNNSLNNLLVQAERNLISYIDDVYIHIPYAHVVVHNAYIEYCKTLFEARTLLEKATASAQNNPTLQTASQRCLTIIDIYIKHIKNGINLIRNQPDWKEQFNGYNAVRARKAQERAAGAAQLIAFSRLLSQQHYHYHRN